MKNILVFLLLFLSFVNGYSQGTCATANYIGSIPFSATGLTTCGQGNNYSSNDACNSNYLNGDDYVFEYTPTINQTLDITVSNHAGWTGWFVTQGCPDVGSCIASETGSGTGALNNLASLSAGVTYYIVVSTYPTPQCTSFDISIDEVVVGEDDCSDAVQMNDGQIYNSSNQLATADLCLGS